MQKNRTFGFISAAFTLTAIFTASGAPLPLFDTYSKLYNFSSGDMVFAIVVYLFSMMVTLLCLARLSNHLGRKPITLLALAVGAISSLFFIFINGVEMLLLGRFIQGIACGLAQSCITAYVVDNVPEKHFWLGAAVTNGSPNLGIGLGAVLSGVIMEKTGSTTLFIMVLLFVLALCAIFIIFSPETVQKTTGAYKSLFPQVGVPKRVRYLLPAASAVYIGCWVVGGFYQAFSSTIASNQFGTGNTIAAGAVMFSLVIPTTIGGYLTGAIKPRKAQRIGISICAFGIALVVFSLWKNITVLFYISTIITGLSFGMAFTGSMRGFLREITQAERAGVLSAIYLIAYSGSMLPNLIIGLISEKISVFEVSILYGIVIIAAWILTILFSNDGRKNEVYKTATRQ